jgi:hypothetical protein
MTARRIQTTSRAFFAGSLGLRPDFVVVCVISGEAFLVAAGAGSIWKVEAGACVFRQCLDRIPEQQPAMAGEPSVTSGPW